MSQILAGYCLDRKCQFVIAGTEVPPAGLFDSKMMLPVVTARAQAQALSLLGHGLSCMVLPDDGSLLSVRAEVPDVSMGRVSDLIRALFFIQSAEDIFGISRGGLIDCGPVYDFFSKPISERVDLTQNNLEVQWPLAQPVRVQ